MACVVGVALMLAQGVEGGLLVALPTLGIGVGLPIWVLSATNYRLATRTISSASCRAEEARH